jgi:hypothetical protein
MVSLTTLYKWFENRPLILLRFPEGVEDALRESKHRRNRFTWAAPHSAYRDLKVPTLCLIEMQDGRSRSFYVGVVLRKAPVTTFDSALTIAKLHRLNLRSLNALTKSLPGKRAQNDFGRKVRSQDHAIALTPKLSKSIVESLAKNRENESAIKITSSHIPRMERKPLTRWEQLDAIKTAIAAFARNRTDVSQYIEIIENSDSTLSEIDAVRVRILEDNVINFDANVIPGFRLVEQNLTGRAVFVRGDERLDVYTANRGPLEEMLGVDLIYVNEQSGSIVMVQYKMLETQDKTTASQSDLIFRVDEQLREDFRRMKLPAVEAQNDDYRIDSNPFFFKFIRRTGDGYRHRSFILSFEHLKRLLGSEKGKGPRGGLRLSYRDLNGVYLRGSALIELIRSGYIGTHRNQSDVLYPFILAAVDGNRGVVLAWQHLTSSTDNTDLIPEWSEYVDDDIEPPASF